MRHAQSGKGQSVRGCAIAYTTDADIKDVGDVGIKEFCVAIGELAEATKGKWARG